MTLLGAGSVLAALSLAFHFQRAADITRALGPGAVGGVLLFLLGVALVPNTAVFGASYAIGPGFAVGVGTAVSPAGVTLGAVPAVPWLATLPQTGPAPAVSLPVVLAPILAGALAGMLVARRASFLTAERAALWAGGAGALTAVALGILAAIAGGPVGGGRLSAVGPSSWQVMLVATASLGLSAAAAAWQQHRWSCRRPS
jgi:hypothetical protein